MSTTAPSFGAGWVVAGTPTSSHGGIAAMRRDASLLILTFSSKDGEVVPSLIERTLCPLTPAPQCPVVNLARLYPEMGAHYSKHRTKLDALLRYLSDYGSKLEALHRYNQSKPDALHRNHREMLYAFVDGADVAWTGCGFPRGTIDPHKQMALLTELVKALVAKKDVRNLKEFLCINHVMLLSLFA